LDLELNNDFIYVNFLIMKRVFNSIIPIFLLLLTSFTSIEEQDNQSKFPENQLCGPNFYASNESPEECTISGVWFTSIGEYYPLGYTYGQSGHFADPSLPNPFTFKVFVSGPCNSVTLIVNSVVISSLPGQPTGGQYIFSNVANGCGTFLILVE